MDVVVLPHSSVKQHAFGAVVVDVRAAVAVALRFTRAARELRNVGVELIEVGGLEGLAVVDASRLVKPDLVLTSPQGERIVIDTKWKLIRDGRPSDADLKQMFVYNLYWKTDRSTPQGAPCRY